MEAIKYQYIPISVAEIQNTDNAKFRPERGATGALIHRWYKGKIAQLLWKMVCLFLTKPNTLLLHDPAILLLGVEPEDVNMFVHMNSAHKYL